jgi:hypothetical protein
LLASSLKVFGFMALLWTSELKYLLIVATLWSNISSTRCFLYLLNYIKHYFRVSYWCLYINYLNYDCSKPRLSRFSDIVNSNIIIRMKVIRILKVKIYNIYHFNHNTIWKRYQPLSHTCANLNIFTMTSSASY